MDMGEKNQGSLQSFSPEQERELQFIGAVLLGYYLEQRRFGIRNQEFSFGHIKSEMLLIIQLEICLSYKSSGERLGLGVVKVYMEFIVLSSPRYE